MHALHCLKSHSTLVHAAACQTYIPLLDLDGRHFVLKDISGWCLIRHNCGRDTNKVQPSNVTHMRVYISHMYINMHIPHVSCICKDTSVHENEEKPDHPYNMRQKQATGLTTGRRLS